MSVFKDLEIRDMRFVPVVVQDLQPDGLRLQLTLRHDASGRGMVMRVDAQAGAVIQLLSNGDALPVPLPQQLVASMAAALGAEVLAGIVNDRNDDGSYAGTIRVGKQGRHVEIPSRASDAIAVALAGGGELLVAPHLLQDPR